MIRCLIGALSLQDGSKSLHILLNVTDIYLVIFRNDFTSAMFNLMKQIYELAP